MLIKLALKSIRDRQGSIVLSIMAMTVSILVLLGVEHIRHQTKASFSNTVSGVDLIVGARTGSLNLLLYSVFKIGKPTNNISWFSFEKITANEKVTWAVPFSLGDSHKGFRVLGTTQGYFKHFKYGHKHSLNFKEGVMFNNIFEVVLGAQVAKKLGYQLGDSLVLAHGIAKTSFSLHENNPFTVVGILAPTGTPVDHSLHVSLQGIEAIHFNWQGANSLSTESPVAMLAENLQPKSITGLMLGLKSKMTTFRLQREINNDKTEPLLAILPGVALAELWQMMSILENTLFLISALVFIAACLGVNAMLLSSIRERIQEIQLLRMIGASPLFLFLLIEIDALFITMMSIILGSSLLALSLLFAQDYLVSYLGLQISANIFASQPIFLLSAVLSTSFIITAIPSIIGYTQLQRKC